MVSLHRGRFVVVHLCSSFPINPQNFSRWANFYQKLSYLVPYGHSFKATTLKFRTTCALLGLPPPGKILQKSLKLIYPFGENLYQKLLFLAIFWAESPHLISQNSKIWREGANLGDPPRCQIL